MKNVMKALECVLQMRERESEIEKECLKDNEERERERTEVKNC
jgi:hypothetical protein